MGHMVAFIPLTAAPTALATSRYRGLMSCDTPDKVSLTIMLPPPTRITIASPGLVFALSIASSRVLLISKSPKALTSGSIFSVCAFVSTRSVACLDFQHQLPFTGASYRKSYRKSGTAKVYSLLFQMVANGLRTNRETLPNSLVDADTRASAEGETLYIWNTEIRPDAGDFHKCPRLPWEPTGEEGTNVCGGSARSVVLAMLKAP